MHRLLAVAALALVVAPFALSAVGSAQVSSNWSGYVVGAPQGAAPLSFTDATGTWRVPKITCTRAGTSAAFWVGIGGSSDTSPALEQLGSSADCSTNKVATYRAWTEIVPAPARFLSMKVQPGDVLNAALLIQGQTVVMSLTNLTRGTRFSTRMTPAQPLDLTSAEWIAEAPSLCRNATTCQVVPLSKFGSVGFTKIAATANGHTGVLTDPAWAVTPVVLATSAGASRYTASSNAAGAVPNPIAAGGGSFTVSYRASLNQAVPARPLAGAPLPDFVR